MRPDREEGGESGLARQDDDLTGNSSGGTNLPSAKADIILAHTPLQVIKVRAREVVRRVLKPSASVTIPDTVTAEEDLAGSALTANPTRDSNTIITRRPQPPADDPDSVDGDPTTVNFGVKLRDYFEIMGSLVTRRPIFVRATTFGMLVTFSVGTVSILGALDVITRMADALWTGLTMIAVFSLVLGLGIWFVDRQHSH